ncbi:MAG TPA: cytochrome P460 family protein [Acidobacteriota bacterium]|nr:cytochrome P460 family protein [Acidobacteriota bacterium]
MKHTLLLAVALAAGMTLCASLQGGTGQRILALPEDLAGYRTWKTLTKAPYEIPLELWVQCIAPANADSEATQKANGSRAQRMIQVYANRDAERALKNEQNKGLPIGSILAKEKILIKDGSRPEFSGVAFMVKRSPDQFPETGGWEFRYFPSNETDRGQIQQACSGCHKTARRDYVFAEHISKK